MRKLMNTLYINSEGVYLALDGENVLARRDSELIARYPLHTLEGILSFSYMGASPALMGACAERGIQLSFCTPRGRFLAQSVCRSRGNVVTRRTQFRVADDEAASCGYARMMLIGKVYNSSRVVRRTLRDHAMRVDAQRLEAASQYLGAALTKIRAAVSTDSLRGLEGDAASVYFAVMDELILNSKEDFFFKTRSRRPPMDRFNALLSFAYSLLASDCAAALEAQGLDSCVGFLHCDRSGRAGLALDLMEELRPCVADRFVLTLVNNRVLRGGDFAVRENGAVSLSDEARKRFLTAWQERKREVITHPFLKEKLPWGLVPFVQAQLLARSLRGDIDAYPPFLWK